MARIRSIKPETFFDEELCELPFDVRYAFIGLWCYADREGRLVDSPKKLKAYIFPYDKVDMEAVLSKLTAKPFIVRYEENGGKYIQIINFAKHQRPHHTETDSVIPEPKTHDNGCLTVKSPLQDGEKPAGREGKGRERRVFITSSLSDEDFLTALKTNPAYQHINIEAELGKMDAWLLTKPHRKKTRRFILAWLNRIDKPMQAQQENKIKLGRQL